MMDALGTSSCRLQSLPQQHASEYRYARDIPPPGRLMLSTRPYLIGSSPLARTIGIVEVGGERP
jgi:hypothetical protein